MPIVNAYADLEQVKLALDITNEQEDAQIENAINAASRTIDSITNSRFYVEGSEAKYFEPHFVDELWIPPCVSIDEVAVDSGRDRQYSTVIPTAEVEHDDAPFTHIHLAPNATALFPLFRRGVRVTGRWGSSEEANRPADVTAACILIAMKIFKMKDSIYGVQNAIGVGEVTDVYPRVARDPRVADLLRSHIFHEVV